MNNNTKQERINRSANKKTTSVQDNSSAQPSSKSGASRHLNLEKRTAVKPVVVTSGGQPTSGSSQQMFQQPNSCSQKTTVYIPQSPSVPHNNAYAGHRLMRMNWQSTPTIQVQQSLSKQQSTPVTHFRQNLIGSSASGGAAGRTLSSHFDTPQAHDQNQTQQSNNIGQKAASGIAMQLSDIDGSAEDQSFDHSKKQFDLLQTGSALGSTSIYKPRKHNSAVQQLLLAAKQTSGSGVGSGAQCTNEEPAIQKQRVVPSRFAHANLRSHQSPETPNSSLKAASNELWVPRKGGVIGRMRINSSSNISEGNQDYENMLPQATAVVRENLPAIRTNIAAADQDLIMAAGQFECSTYHNRSGEQLHEAPFDREITPKREEASAAIVMGQHATAAGAAYQRAIQQASPYQQKIGADGMQRTFFTRPKTRKLLSTAPADRPNQIQSVANLSFQTPLAEQNQEFFNPIREGHQSGCYEEEESFGNSLHKAFSVPNHDTTLQPTSKAFSISGINRHDESSNVDHDHYKQTTHNQVSNSQQPSSLSKQSQSVGGDPLTLMQNDESMDGHFLGDSDAEKQNFEGNQIDEKGLRVVCVNHPESELQSFKRIRNVKIEPLLLGKRSKEETQVRTRLHSNFTSIDRRTGQRSRTIVLVDEYGGDQTDQPISGSDATEKQLKLEPRIKRQAQSIINRRSSEMMKTIRIDWRVHRSVRVTDPGHSVCCETCHCHDPHNKMRLHAAEHILALNNKEHSVRLNRTVAVMRLGKHSEQPSLAEETDRSIDAPMHYATSSYSSNRFCFKDNSDRGDSKSALQRSKKTKKMKYPERGHHRETQPRGSSNRRHHDAGQERDSRSGSRQFYKRRQHGDQHHQQLPTISPGEGEQSRVARHANHQDHPNHEMKDKKRNNYKTGAHSSNMSYYSSTKFPNAPSRNQFYPIQRNNTEGFKDIKKRHHQHHHQGRHRSRSRLHSRGFSHSSSTSHNRKKHQRSDLNNHDKDNHQRSFRGSQQRFSGRDPQFTASHNYQRQQTMTHQSRSSQRRPQRHHNEVRSSNQSRLRHHEEDHPSQKYHNHHHSSRPGAYHQRSFVESSRMSKRHNYPNYQSKQRQRKEEHFLGLKDAFYSKKRRHYDHSSRGKGSFKTQNERLYRRSRSRGLSSFSSRGGGSLISSYSRGPPISSFKHSKKFPSKHSSVSPGANHSGGLPQIDRSKDTGHFEWSKNMILQESQPAKKSGRYKVVDHLGDGTFGRALKCVEQSSLPDKQDKVYAVKVVRAVPRYTDSAKFEASILEDLEKQGGCDRGIVYLKETFTNRSRQSHGDANNMCLVFEPLGKSLYDFIKDNGYKGFEICQVREIAMQSLQAIEFLHSIKLTHTDLKPENILLKSDAKEIITDERQFPIQVQHKRGIYGSQKCSDIDDNSYFSGQSSHVRGRKWLKPNSAEVKVIDFGGATYEHERHTLIINTRQYRAPEVILENHTWNEKSDIWSMACILIELYTGELFFDTDENVEHLAMIEKQCGPIPLQMAQRCENDQIKRQLHRDGNSEEENYVRNKRMRLRPAALRMPSRQALNSMLLLDDIISEKWGKMHSTFKDLLKLMLKIDPRERPSANECLAHPFFSDVRKFSKSTEKTQVSTADHQFESPRLKH